MEEKEKLFIENALKVFMKYGIKSVTMDDLARHLGISKKTIYNYVKDKNDLVEKVLMFQCTSESQEVELICTKELNAIDEMFEIGMFVSDMLKNLHPAIHYDLEKYHAEAFKKSKEVHQKSIYTCLVKNLEKGIREGLYREDLKIEVIAKIYIHKIEVVFDTKIFPTNQFSFEEVYSVLFRYHILGVSSPKGAEYLYEKQKSLTFPL